MLLMIYSDCVGPQLTGFPTPPSRARMSVPQTRRWYLSPQGAASSNYQMTPGLSAVSCWAETIVADSLD